MSITEGDFDVCDVCHNHPEPAKSVCSHCLYNLLISFKEKEEFCKQNGDPLTMIVEKLNEHTKAINSITELLNSSGANKHTNKEKLI